MTWIDSIQASRYAIEIRDSTFIYPLLQVVHIAAIAALAGSLVIAGARVLGAGTSIPFEGLLRLMKPVLVAGGIVAILTGTHMAIGFIDVFAVNPVMWAKLAILASLLAIAIYQFALQREVLLASSSSGEVPTLHKLLAAVSMIGWPSLIVLGKLLAYIGGKD